MKEAVALSVPGKTFLVGEYVALDGGPSIVLATRPCFEMKISPFQQDSTQGNHHVLAEDSRYSASADHSIVPIMPFAALSPAGSFLSLP
jgi:mevalonate kinase